MKLEAVWSTAENSNVEADTYHFFTKYLGGSSGVAYVGTICHPGAGRRYKTGITARLSTILRTSNVSFFLELSFL